MSCNAKVMQNEFFYKDIEAVAVVVVGCGGGGVVVRRQTKALSSFLARRLVGLQTL